VETENMGDYGRVDVSAYGHNGMTVQRVEDFESAVASWLSKGPGSFSSKDAIGLYAAALEEFSESSGRSETRDYFEIALARLGYRAGVTVFGGEPLWLLILPANSGTTSTRSEAIEVR